MTGKVLSWVKLEIDDDERKRIKDAIKVMDEVAECYAKAASDCEWIVEDLMDGQSALMNVLEGNYV